MTKKNMMTSPRMTIIAISPDPSMVPSSCWKPPESSVLSSGVGDTVGTMTAVVGTDINDDTFTAEM